jgi:hypothetical protein
VKTRFYCLALLGGMLLLTVSWLLGSRYRTGRSVTITMVSNQTNRPSGGVTFRLTNRGAHSVFLSEVFVEARTPVGWQTSSRLTPTDPRDVSGGASKDVVVQPLGGTVPWRLRIAYGDEVRYPSLLLIKAEVAMSSRSWGPFSRLRPGDTWMGSNSLASAEVAK